MTDHWKDVKPWCDAGRFGWIARWDAVDAASAKDADAIARLNAEVASLRAQVQEDAHLRSIVDLYRSDPMAMADALWRMREELGRLRSVVEEPHDVPPEERDRA